jgi:signal transduction histidine kinase
MSETGEHPLLGGSRQALMLSTVVMAVLAVAVLALGIQDPRLLRLGLVAALWAALLGAFATARVRRESSSLAEHADQLRTLDQRELEVERELREQAQRSQRREIMELRTELTTLRASLEQLLGSKPQAAAEPANLFPQFRFGAQGRHGAQGREWSGSNQAPSTAAQAQLTVSDVLAAHGVASPPEGVFRHSVGGVVR